MIDPNKSLDYIVMHGLESEAIAFLAGMLNQKTMEYNDLAREARSSLKAIRRINNGKNSAIDALCDVDGAEAVLMPKELEE